MKWFNTNTLHNVINVLIGVICTGALTGFDWTLFGVSDNAALRITGYLALLKIIINVCRDGPVGMVSPQPPVKK